MSSIEDLNMDPKGIVSLTKNFEDFVANDLFIDDNTNLLITASHGPITLEYIAILSNCVTDPSLISEGMPEKSFKNLTTPSSFKASISEAVTVTNKAYRVADSAMSKIQSSLADVPDNLINVLKTINQPPENKSSQKILNRRLARIETSVTKCKEHAESAYNGFSKVLDFFNELYQATIVSSTFYEREKKEKLEQQICLDNERKTCEDLTKTLKQEFQNAEKNSNEARKEYRKQIHGYDALIKLLTLEGIDCAKDITKLIISPETEMISSLADFAKNGLKKQKEFEENKKSAANALTYAKQMNLAQALEKIANSLDSSTSFATATEYINTLKAFEHTTFWSSEGIVLLRNTNKCRQFLEQNGESLGSEENRKQINDLKVSLRNDVTACISAMEEKKTEHRKQKAVKASTREQIIIADKEKTCTVSEIYKRESEISEKRRNEFNEKVEQLRKVIHELQGIDIRTADLTQIIECLKNALAFIATATESWGKLVTFFNKIKIIVEINLSDNITSFTEEAEDPDGLSKEIMVQSYSKAILYCIQITTCAKIYSLTSQKHIMPVIDGILNYFNLKPNEVEQKQSEFEAKREEIESNVRKSIEDAMEKFEENVEKHKKELKTKLAAALMLKIT